MKSQCPYGPQGRNSLRSAVRPLLLPVITLGVHPWLALRKKPLRIIRLLRESPLAGEAQESGGGSVCPEDADPSALLENADGGT